MFFVGRDEVVFVIFVLHDIAIAVGIRVGIARLTEEVASKSLAEKRNVFRRDASFFTYNAR
jgi:hypothetical protein